MQSYKSFIEKCAWALAPLAWGSFVWFMDWGLGSFYIVYPWLNHAIRVVGSFVVIQYFLGRSLDYAVDHYQLEFFGYPIWLPSWRMFIVILIFCVGALVTPLRNYVIVDVFVAGVCISPIIEEFITRSFFVKYKMKFVEFLCFNIFSSLAFMYMHSLYAKEGLDLLTLIYRGHFLFSFCLGLIVYKTRRIELTIILHMLANMFIYTIPICIFACPWPSSLAIGLNKFYYIVFNLCLAGCTYKLVTNNKEIVKN